MSSIQPPNQHLVGKKFIDPDDSQGLLEVVEVCSAEPEYVLVRFIGTETVWQQSTESVEALLHSVVADLSKHGTFETFDNPDRSAKLHYYSEYLCNGYRFEIAEEEGTDTTPSLFSVTAIGSTPSASNQPGLRTKIKINCKERWEAKSWGEAEMIAFPRIYRHAFLADGITYSQLEKLYQQGQAQFAVDHINHREIVWRGTRYYCGWSSEKTDTTPGWIVYDAAKEINLSLIDVAVVPMAKAERVKSFSQYEQEISALIKSATPSDYLVDLDKQDLDEIKGQILTHLMQNNGRVSDSDVCAIVREILAKL
jgi:hypothetical protein